MDSVQQHYEAIPYAAYVHGTTHPTRLAAKALLAGVTAPDPRTARVLEIGCGPGLNTITIAHTLPRARCVGIDVSSRHIDMARSIAAETSVDNVELRQADLRTFADAEGFDYIIAHGVFSWVPDDVKDALARLCRSCLRPGGIAYISFNTLPGWAPAMTMRKLLGALPGPGMGVIDPSHRKVVEALATQWRTDMRYIGWLRIAEQFLAADPSYLTHDHLGVTNDPYYLLDFADYMGQRGMRYLGDAITPFGTTETVTPEVQQVMADLKLSPLQCEQMVDFAVAQTHRAALLVRDDTPVGGFTPQSLEDLLIATFLAPGPPGPDGLPAHYLTLDRKTVQFQDPFLNRFVLMLANKSPAPIPFAQAASAALAHPESQARPRPGTRQQLYEATVNLMASRIMFAVVADPCMRTGRELPPRPAISPLNRHLARHHKYVVNSVAHHITLTEPRAAFVAELDGSRTLGEVQKATALPEPEWRALLVYLWQQGVIHPAG